MPPFEEVMERRFRVTGTPVLRAENVAGGTRIRGGAGDEVVVRVTKRADAESADRGKRLLENLVVEVQQRGDEVRVSQRAYLAERAWLGLFVGRRVIADYDIEVPIRADVRARTTSGGIDVGGISGGRVRLHAVSGDCAVEECAVDVSANCVSGDVRFERCSLGSAEVRTVSGDVEAAVVMAPAGRYAFGTVSGDVTIATPSACEIQFHSISGEAHADGGGRVERLGRRRHLVGQGSGGPAVAVNTVSGDLRLRRADVEAPAAAGSSETEVPESKADVLRLLERVARGEVDADEAARLLEAFR